MAVFVDGCFWHGCPEHFRLPKTRTSFWREKVRRNKATRTRVLAQLGPAWRIFQFYECDLEGRVDDCAKQVANAIRNRKTQVDVHAVEKATTLFGAPSNHVSWRTPSST